MSDGAREDWLQQQLANNTPEAVWAAPTVYRDDLLAGQTVVVSGGGSGIGRAVALLCARLGAHVVICGRTQEKLDAVTAFARERGAAMHALQRQCPRRRGGGCAVLAHNG